MLELPRRGDSNINSQVMIMCRNFGQFIILNLNPDLTQLKCKPVGTLGPFLLVRKPSHDSLAMCLEYLTD